MIDPNVILLYVDNPATSSAFYAGLLGKEPIQSSPSFAMFALDSGVRLDFFTVSADGHHFAVARGTLTDFFSDDSP